MRGKRGTARHAGLLAALATAILQACTGYAPKAETAKVVASLSERDCLVGERYAPIGNAMHFHVAGLNIPYRVQYVAMAGGNAFYLKTDRRRGDLAAVRDQSATDGVLLASTSTKETTPAAATPKPGVMQWLYATFAEAQPSESCDQTATAFGATSLACEEERAAR